MSRPDPTPSTNKPTLQLSLNEVLQTTGANLGPSSVVDIDSIIVEGIAPLDKASEHQISFFSPTSPKSHAELIKSAAQSQAAAIIVKEELPEIKRPQLIHPHPLAAVAQLGGRFRIKPFVPEGIHPSAVIAESAQISEKVSIGPYVVVGENVEIGENCTLHAHCVIYDYASIGNNCLLHSGATVREGVKIGDNCLIQNGAVIGSDGFGYHVGANGERQLIPHLGTVQVSDRVDIGANSAIDRGTLGNTRLGQAVKVDNLVQIGHNNQILDRAVLCGTVALAGSCEIGEDAVLGGNTGVADHVKIGAKVQTGGKTGVTGDIPAGSVVAGFPAQDIKQWRRQVLALKKLPSVFSDLRKLKKQLDNKEDNT